MHSVIHKIAPSFDFNTKKLAEAYALATERYANLVLLSNHLSHLDAPLIDLAIREAGYSPRFVCGAFMFYNPHMRPFIRACDTVFVFGPKDQKNLARLLLSQQVDREGKEKVIALLEDFNSRVRDTIAKNR